MINLPLPDSVGVGREISSSYEHVDRFQSLLNKEAAEASRGLRDEKSSGAMQVDEDRFINHISALSRLKPM